MEKGFESWVFHQHSPKQEFDLNSFNVLTNLNSQNAVPFSHMNPNANGTLPVYDFSGLPYFKASQPDEPPRGWFYCMPRFRQAFAPPLLDTVPKDKLPTVGNENFITGPGVGQQKRFLVFDQTGDQTLIFSPGIGKPVHCPASWNPKPVRACDLIKEDLEIKREMNCYNDDESRGYDLSSEMHEDTEEINALLYSDDDDGDDSSSSDDDEEVSTGHSPSCEETGEEVASSAGPIKKRKLLDGDYDVPPLMAPYGCTEYDEDDAESSSSCGCLSENKRWRKEKIRETVSILQGIIPGGGGEGKDAVAVIDEAIDYLRSLKVKAKTLGLASL